MKRKRIGTFISLVVVFSVMMQLAIMPTVAHAVAPNPSVVSGSDDYGALREGPSTSYAIKVYVPNGDCIVITDDSNNWKEVFYINPDDGKVYYGYMHYSVIHEYRTNTIKEVHITPPDTLNLRAAPNGTILTTISNMKQVIMITDGTTWDYVLYNGIKGYVYDSYLYNTFSILYTPTVIGGTTRPSGTQGYISCPFAKYNTQYQFTCSYGSAWVYRSDQSRTSLSFGE